MAMMQKEAQAGARHTSAKLASVPSHRGPILQDAEHARALGAGRKGAEPFVISQEPSPSCICTHSERSCCIGNTSTSQVDRLTFFNKRNFSAVAFLL